MKIELDKRDNATVISLHKAIISRDDQLAVNELIDLTLDEGERTLVLDLSNVPYVTSLGIAVLVGAHVRVSRAGGTLRLVNPRPKVTSILEMTRTADMFRTYASVEEALGED